MLTIDPAMGKERYQGVVEIVGDALADSLKHYLAHSEQLDSHIWLAADERFATGMLLQRIPGDMSDEQLGTWERATHLAGTITGKELLELPGQQVLHRLFHESAVSV